MNRTALDASVPQRFLPGGWAWMPPEESPWATLEWSKREEVFREARSMARKHSPGGGSRYRGRRALQKDAKHGQQERTARREMYLRRAIKRARLGR